LLEIYLKTNSYFITNWSQVITITGRLHGQVGKQACCVNLLEIMGSKRRGGLRSQEFAMFENLLPIQLLKRVDRLFRATLKEDCLK
jgi:hypothetical protein